MEKIEKEKEDLYQLYTKYKRTSQLLEEKCNRYKQELENLRPLEEEVSLLKSRIDNLQQVLDEERAQFQRNKEKMVCATSGNMHIHIYIRERNRSELLSRLDSIFDGDLANGLHAMLYAEARENKLFQSPMQAPTQIQSQIQSQSQSQTQMQELDEYAKQSPKPGILESSSMDNFVIQSEDTPFSETHEESDVIDSSNTRTKGKVQSSSRSRAETTIKHDDEQDNEVPTYPVGNILSRSSKEIHSP
ncbi:hypothetical protein RFI_16521, partial [Reticulomyxa filosa]